MDSYYANSYPRLYPDYAGQPALLQATSHSSAYYPMTSMFAQQNGASAAAATGTASSGSHEDGKLCFCCFAGSQFLFGDEKFLLLVL